MATQKGNSLSRSTDLTECGRWWWGFRSEACAADEERISAETDAPHGWVQKHGCLRVRQFPGIVSAITRA